MVDIRPNALPDAILPLRDTDELIVDQGTDGVRKAPPAEAVNSVAPVASQAEAVAGADNVKRMTPLRTKQSIASEVGVTLASNAQGGKADSAVQSVNGKSGNSVTLVKADLGLGNVDNTSDADKPISTATQAALDGKASSAQGAKADSAVQSINGKTGNTITLTKADVGLGNVDNTSDANKPVSTAQQAAISLKANSSVTITAGTGLSGGGDLSANRTVSLNAATIASLNKADQSVRFQDTRATAIAASYPSGVNFIEISGYSSVGDGGGALYKNVASEPAHPGKFQSSDGKWWEVVLTTANVKQFGAKGDGVSDDTAACRNAFLYSYTTAQTNRGGMDIFFPTGTYLVDTLEYSPTAYIPVKIHGSGKTSTFIRKRLASSNTNVIQIGNDPSTTYRGEIEIADMTIDGYDGNGTGLALYEVWYSVIRNVRISNCNTGVLGAAAIYIDFYSPDITWNSVGMDINTFPGASFPGTNPAMINIYGGIIWRNSTVGIQADYFNEINCYGTGFEKNGTTNATTHGAIVTGSNVDRTSRSTGVSMFGGWVEDNNGLSQLRFGSGFNSINNVRFWNGDSVCSYLMQFVTGNYNVSYCTTTPGPTSVIREESTITAGNSISLSNDFITQVSTNKTSINQGSAAKWNFLTVGGSDVSTQGIVIQNTDTYYNFTIVGSQLKLYQGTVEVGSWGT